MLIEQVGVRKISAAACALAIAGAALFAVLRQAPAPQVRFTSLQGEQFRMHDLRGKVVLVNFWATDCAPCMHEMPKMIELHRAYHVRGFESIFVAMRHDRPDYVIHYSERNALPFKVVLDVRGELASAFGNVELTPTAFLIDKRGMIISRTVGEPDFVKLRALLEQALMQAQQAAFTPSGRAGRSGSA
jgi:thiol-disulfide isomerase/thioredoxin